jgi:hypothetical protein
MVRLKALGELGEKVLRGDVLSAERPLKIHHHWPHAAERNQMSKVSQEIETLRQEAAQRAITSFYNSVENLSMFDVRVNDVMQLFAHEAWQARDLKPFRSGPVPAAEQREHLQRLKDVIQCHAEQSLVDAAETLWGSGLGRGDIINKLDHAFGPQFYLDDEHEEGVNPALAKAKTEYAAGTLEPKVRATIESIFGEGFFTGDRGNRQV